MGFLVLLVSIFAAGIAATIMHEELRLIGFGDRLEGQKFTLILGEVREHARPLLFLSVLFGWTGIIVTGVAACLLWARYPTRRAMPALTFVGLSFVAAALVGAFYPLWAFLTYEPNCVASLTCAREEWQRILDITWHLLESAKSAVIAFVVLEAAGLLLSGVGLDGMQLERAGFARG